MLLQKNYLKLRVKTWIRCLILKVICGFLKQEKYLLRMLHLRKLIKNKSDGIRIKIRVNQEGNGMVKSILVDVDFNGIVLFDYP